jgi:hypothetical protein
VTAAPPTRAVVTPGKPLSDVDIALNAHMTAKFESCRPDLSWYKRYWGFVKGTYRIETPEVGFDVEWTPLERVEGGLFVVVLIWLGYGAGLYIAGLSQTGIRHRPHRLFS